MKFRVITMAAAFAVAALATPVHAKTFRYAFQGDLNALDPYTLNETFTLGALGNVGKGQRAAGSQQRGGRFDRRFHASWSTARNALIRSNSAVAYSGSSGVSPVTAA